MNRQTPITIEQLCSDQIIDAAYAQLCKQWQGKGDNHGIWSLRFRWEQNKSELRALLLSGTYRFSPCRSVKINDHSIGIWNAQDALVIKMLSNLIGERILPTLSKRCTHVKGNGGLKQAVMLAKTASPDFEFVLKSDVKSYYASMKHSLILKQFKRYIQDATLLDLLWQFLTHLDDVNGELFHCEQGIGKGSSLSTLIAALYLDALDQALESYAKQIGGIYIRYVDDWLLLCHKRWHLRKAVKKMNRVLETLCVSKAEKKTFIGKVDKGYDWLGYRIEPVTLKTPTGTNNTPNQHAPSSTTTPSHTSHDTANAPATAQGQNRPAQRATRHYQLTMNKTCITNHLTKFNRLYEQGASPEALATYVKRWWVWAKGGVVLDGGMEAIGYGVWGTALLY